MRSIHIALSSNIRRLCVVLVTVSLFGGCASKQAELVSSTAVPPTPPLQSFIDQAVQSHLEGNLIKERETYRAAAVAYPTDKEPWLRLARGYFDQGDYGNVILSTQEVLHRDATDNVAASLLAVSGLRVSASALSDLRKQNHLETDTRSQAEAVAKLLRDVLGGQIMEPNSAGPSGTIAGNKRHGVKRPPPNTRPSAKQFTEPANPFDKLK